jgi:hypothetical protein
MKLMKRLRRGFNFMWHSDSFPHQGFTPPMAPTQTDELKAEIEKLEKRVVDLENDKKDWFIRNPKQSISVEVYVKNKDFTHLRYREVVGAGELLSGKGEWSKLIPITQGTNIISGLCLNTEYIFSLVTFDPARGITVWSNPYPYIVTDKNYVSIHNKRK